MLYINLPKCSANWVAASLPLGNIIAYKRSFMMNVSPLCKFPVVPGYRAAFLETLVISVSGTILNYLHNFNTVYNVIFFVRLAISLTIKSSFEWSNLPVSPSTIAQHLAETNGGLASCGRFFFRKKVTPYFGNVSK